MSLLKEKQIAALHDTSRGAYDEDLENDTNGKPRSNDLDSVLVHAYLTVKKAVMSRIHTRNDVYWVMLLSGLFLFCIVHMSLENIHFRKIRAEQPSYPWPAWTALLQPFLFFLAVIVATRSFLSKYIIRPLGPRLIKNKNFTNEELDSRIERLGACAFKLFYFIVTTRIGWMFLKDKDWFPTHLGGHGELNNIWNQWPFTPHTTGVTLYYAWQLAYHFHSIVYQFMHSHRRDFFEMMLHHSATLVLIVISYNENFLRIGCLIMFLHDVPDVSIYLCKVLNDTTGTVPTISAWALMVALCGYFRLYFLPILIHNLYFVAYTLVDSKYYIWSLPNFYAFTLSLLVVLHAFWWGLFWKMIFDTIKKKEVVQDMVDEVVVPKGSVEEPSAAHRRAAAGDKAAAHIV